MEPGYGNGVVIRRKIEISKKNYEVTDNAIKTSEFEVADNRTIEEFCRTINERGCERYNFINELEKRRY